MMRERERDDDDKGPHRSENALSLPLLHCFLRRNFRSCRTCKFPSIKVEISFASVESEKIRQLSVVTILCLWYTLIHLLRAYPMYLRAFKFIPGLSLSGNHLPIKINKKLWDVF